MPRSDQTRRTQQNGWHDSFLRALALNADVSGAAKAAGIGRGTAYDRRRKDPTFAARWDDAIEQALDRFEAELVRRGVEGWLEPVYYKGAIVGDIRRYDTTALLAKLNARGKHRGYGRTDIQHSGDQERPIVIRDARERLTGELARLAASNGAGAAHTDA